MDIGLFLLRSVIAAVLAIHAAQKTVGWFSGPALSGAVPVFEGLGHRPARTMIVIAAASELIGAALLLLGAATPLAVAIVVGTMLVAGLSLCMARRALWNSSGGGEYPLVLALVCAPLAFTGPGGWSVDHVFRAWWAEPGSAQVGFGVAELMAAVLAALPALVRARKVLAGRA